MCSQVQGASAGSREGLTYLLGTSVVGGWRHVSAGAGVVRAEAAAAGHLAQLLCHNPRLVAACRGQSGGDEVAMAWRRAVRQGLAVERLHARNNQTRAPTTHGTGVTDSSATVKSRHWTNLEP